MSILDYLLRRKPKTASVAKDRLQIILAHAHSDRSDPDFLPVLKRELLDVISRYVNVDLDQVEVNLDHDGDHEILEVNVVLPESEHFQIPKMQPQKTSQKTHKPYKTRKNRKSAARA